MLYGFNVKWFWPQSVEVSVASASFQEARTGLATLNDVKSL